jgi:hypothetical protein
VAHPKHRQLRHLSLQGMCTNTSRSMSISTSTPTRSGTSTAAGQGEAIRVWAMRITSSDQKLHDTDTGAQRPLQCALLLSTVKPNIICTR